ncbi:peptidase domain-containing ABC transporter [Massilia forsythiae]|uniref:Cyclolysin secretion/processing ATP-binding protein CyaB n=1 Tax=Massilia forsythiae TaxID=2728020 RepID=A0A7Z2VWY2_9BURK|nr:peptidase domain-containing ABC transporter [Massilia forsythiae]QJE01013.1 peptidase domain-containing ABC transporter [Massilia forsythiae]
MHDYPLQDEVADCGLVCLAVASQQLGVGVDLATLRRLYPMSSRGLTMREVRDIATHMGMTGRAVSCEIEELAQLRTPAILHWGFQHFVVLVKAGRSRLVVHDPAVGRITPTAKELSQQFTGAALELRASPEFKRRSAPSELATASWFRFGRDTWSPLLQILLLSVLLQIYMVATPFFIQLAVDEAALKGDAQLLSVLAWGFGLFCAFNACASLLRGVLVARLTSALGWDMTTRLFRHMVRLPLPWFQRRRLADVLSRFDAIGPVRDLVSGTLVSAVVDGILAIVTLAMMAFVSLPLSLVTLGGLLLYALTRLAALPLNMKFGGAAMMARIAENGKRIETVRAIQTLKVMGAENERELHWSQKLADSLRQDQRLTLANLSFSTIQSLLDGLLRIVLTWMGVRAIIDGQMTIGVLYAFLSYQTQFSAKAALLVDQYIKWRTTSLYSHRLADIVLTPKEKDIDAPPACAGIEIAGGIELRGLAFAYAPHERPVFSNLSLRVAPGEFVAIVGPSGAGKSTLLKVLCGLYPASAGEVLLDGQPLAAWGPKAVRRGLGVVMQDDELLSGTIAENVAFFDEAIDMEWVWHCLRTAALAGDVMAMPLRAETPVGDMGAALSGGQKQRLLLARALYRRPRLLVLDEATSHVDAACEGAINAALKALKITRIVVAHRSETIAAADRVIRLEHGRIAFGSTASRMTEV